MITMRELLADKVYAAYLAERPETPKVAKSKELTPMWVVWVQKESGGKWRRKSFRKYKEAYEFLWKIMGLGYHDAALQNKRVTFDPPDRIVRIKGKYFLDKKGRRQQVTKQVVWKPKLPIGEDEPHHWCMACRRPTVWKHYSKHPGLPGIEQLDYSIRRCCICGGSERVNMRYEDRRFG